MYGVHTLLLQKKGNWDVEGLGELVDGCHMWPFRLLDPVKGLS